MNDWCYLEYLLMARVPLFVPLFMPGGLDAEDAPKRAQKIASITLVMTRARYPQFAQIA